MIVISYAHPTIKRVVPFIAANRRHCHERGNSRRLGCLPCRFLERTRARARGRWFRKTEGTVVSIGKPTNSPNQKWVITAKPNKLYSIKPSYGSALVLAAAKGGQQNRDGYRA